jgi:hypothetical protein
MRLSFPVSHALIFRQSVVWRKGYEKVKSSSVCLFFRVWPKCASSFLSPLDNKRKNILKMQRLFCRRLLYFFIIVSCGPVAIFVSCVLKNPLSVVCVVAKQSKKK